MFTKWYGQPLLFVYLLVTHELLSSGHLWKGDEITPCPDESLLNMSIFEGY
jgi:hypothetical protein